MILINCEQGSPEWFAARLGIPTASGFDKIITPTGRPSTQAEGYMNRLLAEWLMGKPVDIEKSEWMERGTEMEVEARKLYEFQTDTTVETVGLIYQNERKLVACSPDGLVGDGGLEIKCPAPWTHVEYLLNNDIPTKYIPQVQGNIWITGRKWWDFQSYHPDMDPVIVRVRRDETFIKALESELSKFIDKMLAKRIKLKVRSNAALTGAAGSTTGNARANCWA